jgi:uroporphyrinogen-III synthase
LAEYIACAYDEEAHFLYAAGAHIQVDLDGLLKEKGLQVEKLVLYDAHAAEALADTLVEQLKRQQIDAVTFMSQRTAQIFTRLLAQAGIEETSARLHAFCLSDAVARPLEALRWKAVHTPHEATLASMVECIDNTFAG